MWRIKLSQDGTDYNEYVQYRNYRIPNYVMEDSHEKAYLLRFNYGLHAGWRTDHVVFILFK